MIKFGNIITDTQLVNHKKLDYLIYHTYNDFKEVDWDLPSLFIGWKKVKPLFGEKYELSILNNEIIANRVYWEHSFKEQKKKHVDGIFNFTRDCISYRFAKNEYIPIDPVYYGVTSIEELLNLLPTEIEYGFNILIDGMYYLMNDNKIYGVDLYTYKFFGFEIPDIISELRKRIINDISEADLEFTIHDIQQKFPFYSNLKRNFISLLRK